MPIRFVLRWERTECERETLVVPFAGDEVRVKLRRRPGAPVRAIDLSPEYDDLARLARATGRPLRELEREVVALVLSES